MTFLGNTKTTHTHTHTHTTKNRTSQIKILQVFPVFYVLFWCIAFILCQVRLWGHFKSIKKKSYFKSERPVPLWSHYTRHRINKLKEALMTANKMILQSVKFLNNMMCWHYDLKQYRWIILNKMKLFDILSNSSSLLLKRVLCPPKEKCNAFG